MEPVKSPGSAELQVGAREILHTHGGLRGLRGLSRGSSGGRTSLAVRRTVLLSHIAGFTAQRVPVTKIITLVVPGPRLNNNVFSDLKLDDLNIDKNKKYWKY